MTLGPQFHSTRDETRWPPAVGFFFAILTGLLIWAAIIWSIIHYA